MRRVDEMFNEAFQPFKKDKGTKYPSHQSDIDFHKRSTFPSANQGPFLSEADATEYMMVHNSLTKHPRSAEQAAIDRLSSAVSNYHRHGHKWGPDLAIKAFADLDLVFFGGHLSGNVCVKWSSNETDKRLQAATCDAERGAVILGVTEKRRGRGERGQCRIVLNAEQIFSGSSRWDPFEQMIGTLLHEMVHAYDCCRCPDAIELDGDGLRHDAHFGTRLRVIHDRAARLLRLKIIGDNEPYEQKIFFTKDLKPHRHESRKRRSRR